MGRPLWSFASSPEENIVIPDTPVRTHVGAVGIRVDGANRGLPAVSNGRLVNAGTGVSPPRSLGAREDEGTGDLALLYDAQARLFQDGR
jgi:hypothetical protein